MVKVKYTSEELGYKTLGDMRRVNFADKALFIEFLFERLGLLEASYSGTPFDLLIIDYIVRDGVASGDRILLNQPVYQVTAHGYNNFNLPLTMNPNEMGEIISQSQVSEVITRYVVKNNTNIFIVDVSEGGKINHVELAGAADIKWVDTEVDFNTFKRVIGKKYSNGAKR